MSIERTDLAIFKPELLGSSDDAGGQRTKNRVESGKLNELFTAISDIDHAQSAVDIVKAFPALDTDDTALLLDGHVFISQQPTDDLVSMLIAESDDLTDDSRMTDMVEILESSVRAGQLIRNRLIGLLAGQDTFPRSYLQSIYSFNGTEYYESISLQQGQVIVISVEYEGAEDANWPRFEHFCEITKSVTGGVGGSVQFSPPIPFDTPGVDDVINGESGCTHLRYTSFNDGIKYHGVSKLSAESTTEVLSVESTNTELLPKIKTIEISAGNKITDDNDNPDTPTNLIRKEINQAIADYTKTTYVYTVNDIIDDPYFTDNGYLPSHVLVTGSYVHTASATVVGNSVTVVYSGNRFPQLNGETIGISYYSSLKYDIYDSSDTYPVSKKITIGSVKAIATFLDTNYGVVELREVSNGLLRESNDYDLAQIDYLTGGITKYIDGRGDFTIEYKALVEDAAQVENSVEFSLAVASPILETFYMTIASDDDVLLSASSDDTGLITGANINGNIVGGVVSLSFNVGVDLSSLTYDISETVVLNPPPELYGLNPLRMKNGGDVESFTAWNTISVQHTQVQEVANPQDGDLFDVRVGARFVDITDSTGASLWTVDGDNYTVDKESGVVELHSSFDGFTAPFVLTDSIGETALITSVQENSLVLATPLSAVYPVGSVVSSIQNLGDLQARIGQVRDMTSFDNNWDLDGDPATASLNVVDYPIEVVNDTAINEDWVLIFTSSTAFKCVGRRIGQVATGDTLNDFSPINPLTLAPYFVIRQGAWGAGWNAGEAIRFESYASSKPIMMLRTVQSGHSQITTDRATLAFRGNES
ncbi:coil containing protein [Vibrio phage 1.055.O._10N.286.55.E9]|nr:coil containing protein [Vibrio phage 1.055.O._10N.286.55.E9]